MAAIPNYRFEVSCSKNPFSTAPGNEGRRIAGPSYLGMKVSNESQRFRGLRVVNATSGDGGGGGGGGNQINKKNNGGSEGGGNGDNEGKRGDPFESFKWICGTFGLVAVPLWRRIQNVGDNLEDFDKVVEKVESFADKIGNAVRKIAKDLPDGEMKLMASKILRVADNIEDGAGALDDILDKITDTLNEEDGKEEKKDEEKQEKKDEEKQEKKEFHLNQNQATSRTNK